MVDRFQRFSVAIFEISRYWHKLAGEEMKEFGLKGAHATYLTVLYRYERGLTGPELCQKCGKDKSDVSRTVRLLQEKGFVEKEAVNNSFYGGRVRLTQKGRRVARQLSRRAGQAVELAGRDLTPQRREEMYEGLEAIVLRLREMSEAGIPKE